MRLVLVDYTIKTVWSFCNNQLTFTMDRKTRTASGAEELLLHFAIRSADLIIRLHLSVGTFNTCTAPTGVLEMTSGRFKIITFRLLFTYLFKLCIYSLFDLLLLTDFPLTSMPFINIFR